MATSTQLAQMDEGDFWALVEQAKSAAGNQVESRPSALEHLLTGLGLDAIQAFQRRYDVELLRANQWRLWGAAYIMNGGCSDDGFRYFRDWLISEGKTSFNAALKDPDSLAVFPPGRLFELEAYEYAAQRAGEQFGRGKLERDAQMAAAAPEGKAWNESELSTLFPQLAAAFHFKSLNVIRGGKSL